MGISDPLDFKPGMVTGVDVDQDGGSVKITICCGSIYDAMLLHDKIAYHISRNEELMLVFKGMKK